MYEFISGYKLNREVGSQYEYSNLAPGLLGHILAKFNGVSYENLMIEIIANPLMMKETKVNLDKNMISNLAIGHSFSAEIENFEMPTLSGSGGIRSSVHDMFKFLVANLGLVESVLYPAMLETHKLRHNKARYMGVGLGWLIFEGENGNIICHSWGTMGYRASIGFLKETGRGVVVLTNSTERLDNIGFYLLDPNSNLSQITKLAIDTINVEVNKHILKDYVGTYQSSSYDKFKIISDGGKLYMQHLEKKIELFTISENEFYTKVGEGRIVFQSNENGITEKIVAYRYGQELEYLKNTIDLSYYSVLV